MAYCAENEVRIAAGGAAKLLELLDQDADGVADTGVLDAAIEQAEAEMDGPISKQYQVPLDAQYVSNDVKWRCAKLAVLFLRSARGSLSAEHIEEHKAIVMWLDEVASGKIVLGQNPQPPKSSLRVDAQKAPTLREVNREKLKGAW